MGPIQKIISRATFWCILSSVTGTLSSCLKSPFGSSNGDLTYRNFNRNLTQIPKDKTTTASTGGTAGSLAISLGEQMIGRLESDLRAGGLTSNQIAAVTKEARGEMQAEAGKIVISALHGLWLGSSQDQTTGLNLADSSAELMGKLGAAVARGALKSFASDELKNLPAEIKQNTVGIMSTSVITAISGAPEKLSDAGITSVANTVIGSLIQSLPSAGFSGDQLMLSMSKVMQSAVGSLDEAGLSPEATSGTVVQMTQVTLDKASEITKDTAYAGSTIGAVAAAAINGLAATKASGAQSMTAIEAVTTASVKAAVNMDNSKTDIAKSIENLTNLTTKAMANVTASGDTVSGLERLMGAATQAVADASATKNRDLYSKMTASIVAGSVSAVDSVALKSGQGTASLVQTMVVTTATRALQGASSSEAVSMLSEVTGSAVKAFANSSLANDQQARSDAVGSAVNGTVTALSKMTGQDSSTTSSAIQGISRAGTEAVTQISGGTSETSTLTKQIMSTGIATLGSTMSGTDTTKLISLAGDMAKGAATGMASAKSDKLATQMSDLANSAIAGVNQAMARMGGTTSNTTVLSNFATTVAGSITTGLAIGGQSSRDISSITTSLATSIVSSVVSLAPQTDTSTLNQQVVSQAETGAELATNMGSGSMAKCRDKFKDDLSDADFIAALGGKSAGVYCQTVPELPFCPRPRRLVTGDYFWSMSPPYLCEFKPVPVASNSATLATTPAAGTTSATTTQAQVPIAPPIPGMVPPPNLGATSVWAAFVSDRSVDLEWSDISSTLPSLASYAVYRMPGALPTSAAEVTNQGFLLTGNIPGNQPKTTIKPLPPDQLNPNTTYVFSIVGRDSANQTFLVGSIQVTTGPKLLLTNPDVGAVMKNPGVQGFFDPHTKRHWAMIPSSGGLLFKHSPDNMLWSDGPFLSGTYNDVRLDSMAFGNHTVIFLVAQTSGEDIVMRTGTVGPSSIQFTPETYVFTGTGSLDLYTKPDVVVSSSGSELWVAAAHGMGPHLRTLMFRPKTMRFAINYLSTSGVTSLTPLGTAEVLGAAPGYQTNMIYSLQLIKNLNRVLLVVNGSELGVWEHPYSGDPWSPVNANTRKNYTPESLPMDIPGGAVSAIANIGTDIYVGGSFPHMGGIPGTAFLARWNGSQWSPVGDGLNGPVKALAVNNGRLYVGGEFTLVGSMPVSGIAQWVYDHWEPLGFGLTTMDGTTTSVLALEFENSSPGAALYVGGHFHHTAGPTPVPLNHVARWDGSNFTPLFQGGEYGVGTNPLCRVNALKIYANELFVGGFGLTLPHISYTGPVAKWSTSTSQWSTPETSGPRLVNGQVYAFEILSGSTLYMGGSFQANQFTPSLTGAVHLAKLDLSNPIWATAGGSGVSATAGHQVTSLKAHSGFLFAGGFFTNINGTSMNNLAKWNGSAWAVAGTANATNGLVQSLASDGTNLYFGGDFSTIQGSISSPFLGRYNGSLQAFSTNYDLLGVINDAAINPATGDIYVVGSFTKIGGVPATNIAKWSPTTQLWSPIGSGCNNLITSIAHKPFTNLMIVAGSFTNCSGVSSNKIAKLDVSATPTWSQISASGQPSTLTINDMEFDQSGNLYAVGTISPGFNFVKLNSSMTNWTTNLASTGGTPPKTLQITPGGLVVFGGASGLNGLPPGIPLYDLSNSSWNFIPVDTTNAPLVQTVALGPNNTIFVGGSFTSINGVPNTSKLAQVDWDGTNGIWSAITPSATTRINSGLVNSLFWDEEAANLLVGGDLKDFNSNIQGVGVWTAARNDWNHSLATSGKVTKIIPFPPGGSVAAVVVGTFGSIGGLPTGNIGFARRSNMGSGSSQGVSGIAYNQGKIRALAAEGSKLIEHQFTGNDWLKTTIDSTPLVKVSWPTLMGNPSSPTAQAQALWLADRQVRTSQDPNDMGWTLPVSILSGTEVESLAVDRGVGWSDTLKLIFLDITHPFSPSLKVQKANQ